MKQLAVGALLLAAGALWLSGGVAPDVGPTPIECVIAARTMWFLGSTPKIDVKLINRSDRAIYLVGSLDGSDRGRSPRAHFEITPPLDAPSPAPMAFFCGNTNELREADFVKVEPGATFDPHVQDLALSSRFNVPGTYYVRFVYSTTDPDIGNWLGGPLGPGYEPSLRLVELLRQVPKVDLRSNVIPLHFVRP